MAASKKRYAIRAQLFSHGLRVYEVIDRNADTCVFQSIFQSRAIKERNRLNKQELAIPGGFNSRMKT